MPIKRILVPVDFSSESLEALTYAREFAKPLEAELLVLAVVEPLFYVAPTDMYAGSANLATLAEEQRRLFTRELAKLDGELTAAGVPHRTLLRTGAPAQQIVDTAKRQRAAMIVMATHGRTGLAHMLIGSVAEKVVRTATCPVLTVHPTAPPKGKRGLKTARKKPS